MSDQIAPFVVINQNDSKFAWSFTLLHEITHLWLGKTGVSAQVSENIIEKYCNDVASQIILKKEETKLLYDNIISSNNDFIIALSNEANSMNVSASLLAYRCYCQGLITKEIWLSCSESLRRLWIEKRAQSRRDKSNQSGNYYNTQRHKMGNALIDLVRRSLYDGVITETKAGRVLGVSSGNVAEMVGL